MPDVEPDVDPVSAPDSWLTPGVRGIGAASLLSDLGHEIPTSLLPSLLTSTIGAPASALGLIEGISDGAAGIARVAGGALADDPHRRRSTAVGGYATTAVLTAATGGATAVWQVGLLRTGGWAARGLRVPSRNALLADVVAPARYAHRPRRAAAGDPLTPCSRVRNSHVWRVLGSVGGGTMIVRIGIVDSIRELRVELNDDAMVDRM